MKAQVRFHVPNLYLSAFFTLASWFALRVAVLA